MQPLGDLRPIYTQPPTYIKEIVKSSDKIYLVCNKINKPHTIKENNKSEIEDTNISLDLTGNPLAIDLSVDMSLVPLEEHIWSHEDNNPYPVTLNIARKIINKFNRDSSKDADSYIYCVCDGTDRKCTLVLGACQCDDYLERVEIYSEGCFYQKDLTNLEKLKQDHQSNISVPNKQVDSLISATYTVYGNNLRDYKILSVLPYSSCIIYNVSWNACQYEVPEYVQSAEMILQTIIGHKESDMHTLWEQLTILQIYINILLKQPTDLAKVFLADNPKTYMEISEEICCLLEENRGIGKIGFRKKVKESLNMNNLRQEDLIDKLWHILISCNNVGDLKICFHMLFEELAMKESFKPLISDENTSSVAAIINEISSGKLAVPTLSYSQSLQCVIELGIEKLKSDYFYILNHFNCLNYEKLEKHWSKVTGEYNANIKCAPNSQYPKQDVDKVTTKRMRFTSQISTSLIDASERLTMLNCLLKMHIACDFLVLADKARLSTQESFNALVESVAEYILQAETTSYKNYFDCRLEEITVRLQSRDVNCLQSKDPISWSIRLVSKNDRSVDTTVRHHSLKPLFPPTIYDNYDVPLDDNEDGNIYYVTKMIKSAEKL